MLNRPVAPRLGAAAGGICGIVIAVVWISFSSVFVAIGGGSAWKSLRLSTWQHVPCVVDNFQIFDDPTQDDPFTAAVTFRYKAGGRERTGHCLYPTTRPLAASGRTAEAATPGDAATSEVREADYQKLARLQHQYLSAPTALCRVDRHDPDHAALLVKREETWACGICCGERNHRN